MQSPSRRKTLLGASALGAGGLLAAAMNGATAQGAAARGPYEFQVRDLTYLTVEGKARLARLYQPAGPGPFPAALQLHGGAWNAKDRTDGQNTALDLAAAGIVVLSIDFRNAPEAPYPASLQDIHYGIRWLKAHAREFGSSADRVGLYGTSSGGHQALLVSLRPDDPRYRAHALPEAPGMDAKVAFVVAGWAVLYPAERLKLATAAGNQSLIKSHATFFADEAQQLEATPALAIARGEKLFYPPALVFQGTQDEWTTVAQAQELAARWRSAGGQFDLLLLEGERHTFVNEHPFTANSVKAVEAVKAFIRKHGAGRAA